MKKLLIIMSMISLLFAFTVPAIAQEVGAEANASAGIYSEAYPIPRGFLISPEIHYPGLIGYSGPATPGPLFRDVKQLLLYADTFTVKSLQDIVLKSGLLKREDVIKDKKLLAKEIQFVVTKVEGATLIEFGTTRSTEGADSVDVMAMAGVCAAKKGADIVHINAQGVSRSIKSLGWGVGLAFSRATIGTSEDASGVSGGGTGVAGGSAKINDVPWIQWTALKKK